MVTTKKKKKDTKVGQATLENNMAVTQPANLIAMCCLVAAATLDECTSSWLQYTFSPLEATDRYTLTRSTW